MKRETKDRIKSITADILEILFSALEDLGSASLSKRDAYRILYGSGGNYEWPDTKIGRWVESLRQKGYINVTDSARGERSIEFTNKGKLKIVESACQRRKGDKKYRFLSFDIPESMRPSRDRFRRSIKGMGFMQIQKSLWVIDKNVTEFVEAACYEYGVEKYVVYIVSEKTDIDGIIEKMLKKSIKKDIKN